MKASLAWLNDFLDRQLAPEEVRAILTARAATVEGVVRVRADLSEVIIGRVVHAERHPEAEKLWLTKVDAGDEEPLQVVCGAPNVEVGRSYPFARVGATLPGGVRLEKRKIRGQLSNGMLCSARELGLGSDHTGILALDTDAAPGSSFLEATGVGDTQFDIDVLPNRPDLLSHEGLARELAAATGARLQSVVIPNASGSEGPRGKTVEREAATAGVRVVVEDADGCPRYVATVIRGVKVGPSPPWLVERLQALGARTINNVVDATNYMLHGYGQPMHAFDLARLGGEVVVRDARRGERLVTLDGVERALAPGMTVIAGAGAPEAIAGVIGGQGSEVTEATTDILLETAVFNPRRVRATRRALNVSTDASYRFERHVDQERVAERAAFGAKLILAVAGGEVAAPPADACPKPRTPVRLGLRPSRASLVLGDRIQANEAAALLKSVGFTAEEERGDLTVEVPSWRSDAVAEIDLIEEVARLRGYDTFPSEIRPFRPTTVPDDPALAVQRRVRGALAACGLLEIRPMPFVAAEGGDGLRLRNPLAEDEAWLRTSLLPTLARRAEHNLAHMARSVRLFEIGTVFRPSRTARPVEEMHVGAVVMGHSEPPHFTNAQPRSFDPWDVKWIAEVIVKAAGYVDDLRFHINASGGAAGSTARTLWEIRSGERKIGDVVVLSLDAPVWAAPAFAVEVDLTLATGAGHGSQPATYSPLPVTPAAEIDIALIVPDSVPAASVEAAIRQHGGEILESILLFDEFRGQGVDPGSRSLAWRLTFRHPDRTLRDREIEARKDKLIGMLTSEFGVRARAS